MPVFLIKEGLLGIEGAVFIPYTKNLSKKKVASLYKQVYLAIHDFNAIDPKMRYNLKLDKAEFINYYLRRSVFKNAVYHYLV